MGNARALETVYGISLSQFGFVVSEGRVPIHETYSSKLEPEF